MWVHVSGDKYWVVERRFSILPVPINYSFTNKRPTITPAWNIWTLQEILDASVGREDIFTKGCTSAQFRIEYWKMYYTYFTDGTVVDGEWCIRAVFMMMVKPMSSCARDVERALDKGWQLWSEVCNNLKK